MTARWDCYAHVGERRGVLARDLLAAMDRCAIDRAVLVPFLDAPHFDDLLAAVREHSDRFRALCRVDVAAQGVTFESTAALLDRGFLGARVVLPDDGEGDGDGAHGMAALLQALDGQGKVLLVHAPGGIGAQAARIAAWVAQYPRLRVFIPHLGWPCTAQGVPTPGWADGVRALAACERVFCGLSALYFFSRHGPPFEDTFAFVRTVLQAFGPQRCVLAGDYPVTLERCTYTQVWEALVQAIANPAALEQAWAQTPMTLWADIGHLMSDI